MQACDGCSVNNGILCVACTECIFNIQQAQCLEKTSISRYLPLISFYQILLRYNRQSKALSSQKCCNPHPNEEWFSTYPLIRSPSFQVVFKISSFPLSTHFTKRNPIIHLKPPLKTQGLQLASKATTQNGQVRRHKPEIATHANTAYQNAVRTCCR